MENNISLPISVSVASNKFNFLVNKALKGTCISIKKIQINDCNNAVCFEILFQNEFINTNEWTVTPILSDLIKKIFDDTRGSKTNTSLVWIDDKTFKLQLDS